MGDAETQSPYELACSLREYNEQLEQVRELLAAEPGNEEYTDLQTSLLEVIALTEDLLRSAEAPAGGAGGAAPPPPSSGAGGFVSGFSSAPPGASAPLALLRTNWAPGEACSALFSDGQWHPATVQSAAPSGGFRVLFDHYAVPVVLPAASIRQAPRTGVDEVYVGVPAPKRLKIDEKMAGGREPPKKLTIEEGDDEKTKERKRKLLKAFKTKQRLADKDAEQNAKASSWQAFRTGKAATKHKPGFLTKVDKDSMFAVPEGGRVGVIGSGKAPTEMPERKKNLF